MYSTTCATNAGAMNLLTGADAAYPAGAGAMYSTTGAACVTGAEVENSTTGASAASSVGSRRKVLNWRRSNARHRGCDVPDLWSPSSVGRETSHLHVAGLVGVDGLLLGKCDLRILPFGCSEELISIGHRLRQDRHDRKSLHDEERLHMCSVRGWRHAARHPSLARSRATIKTFPYTCVVLCLDNCNKFVNRELICLRYHAGQNDYRYRSEIKSKTIGLYQITDVTDLY